jgi:glucokinase
MLAIGVDVGGTKMKAAVVDAGGQIQGKSLQYPSPRNVNEVIAIIQEIRTLFPHLSPVGIGVGLAGTIDKENGVVRFASNLKWRDVPLQDHLEQALRLRVVVDNDVRAAAYGEWLHGAGQDCNDLVYLSIGTGIGGGVVSGGQILSGYTNTAGELGHIILDLNGPRCQCGNWGCFEALAGGWAIARKAQEAIAAHAEAGAALEKIAAESPEKEITAKVVAQAAREGSSLAQQVIDDVVQVLIAGAASVVNAFNPHRLILGGGVIEGMPELVGRVDQGIRQRALSAACEGLHVLRAQLHNNAGIIGAAVLVINTFAKIG